MMWSLSSWRMAFVRDDTSQQYPNPETVEVERSRSRAYTRNLAADTRHFGISSFTMKFAAAVVLAFVAPASLAFAPIPFGVRTAKTLQAEIRGPTDKAKELKFGWDGTTALGT